MWKIAAALALAGLLLPLEISAQTPAGPTGTDLDDDLDRIRAAADDYRDPESARAAGYQPPPANACVASRAGAMGYHHTNAALLDDQLDLERPEILVYAPTKDGGRSLAGVEYVVPYSAWARDRPPPRILGQDLKRADSLRIWYLHVWLWKANPVGVFADWNPAFTCPS